MAISALNDPSAFRKRTSLSLPAPQVSDAELEDIVKMGSALMPPPEGGGLGNRVTQSLVGDYSSIYKSVPTPQRTPMQEDIIMQEAKNLIALRDITPLHGEELPELYEGTGFGGVTPRTAKLATPNTVLATPNRPGSGSYTPSVSATATPLSVAGSTYTASQTPLRDQFGLNDSSAMMDSYSVSDSMSMSSRADRERERIQKAKLASQLKGLPEPEFTYEITIPEIEEENDK